MLVAVCALTLSTPAAQATTDHSFLIPSQTGPVHHRACAGPLTWALHSDGIEQSGSSLAKETRMWQSILDEVSGATDYTFTQVPAGSPAAIDIHYSSRPETLDLPTGMLAAGTAGVGGIVDLTWQDGHWIARRSVVVLNPSQLRRWAKVPGLRPWVARHELGHALGLGHSADPAQVMSPEFNPLFPSASYQAGDLAGLAALAAVSCPREVPLA